MSDEDEAGQREREAMSQRFWDTKFSRKYSTFGSEPRSKPLRQGKPGSVLDDGMLPYTYAKEWRGKDRKINATVPRVLLHDTFNTLLATTPGPGEYAKVSSGFEHSSRFTSGGAFTVKGKGLDSKLGKVSETKTPAHLMDFATKDEKRKKKTKKTKPSDIEYSGVTLGGVPIENHRIERIREEVQKQQSAPGPNAYANADTPVEKNKVSTNGYRRTPTTALMKGTASGGRRTLLNLQNLSVSIKEGPGPGSYDIAAQTGVSTTLYSAGPIMTFCPEPVLAMTSSKVTSHVGPGTYDIAKAFEASSPPCKIAKQYERATFRTKPREF